MYSCLRKRENVRGRERGREILINTRMRTCIRFDSCTGINRMQESSGIPKPDKLFFSPHFLPFFLFFSHQEYFIFFSLPTPRQWFRQCRMRALRWSGRNHRMVQATAERQMRGVATRSHFCQRNTSAMCSSLVAKTPCQVATATTCGGWMLGTLRRRAAARGNGRCLL